MRDILAAAADDCRFCQWLLDEEWVHYLALADAICRGSNNPQAVLPESVFGVVMEIAIRNDDRLPPPNPRSTLSHLAEEHHRVLFGSGASQFHDLTLACFPYQGLVIKFFGLWDPFARTMACRTRHGFSIFTTSDDPASTHIPTRPIEQEAGSDETFQKASTWLHDCLSAASRNDNSHASCSKPDNGYMPTRLIEIISFEGGRELRLREMQGSPTEPYIALSYCWGGDQPIKLTRALIGKWRIGIPSEKLPKTIQDALVVCEQLGFRFLWVDAFCIMQDDPSDKAVEIAQMPAVYGNSSLTIAASRASSVEEGFLGNRTATDFLDQVFELPYQCQDGQIGSITLTRTRIQPEPLDSRGWILQERLLSPRTLEFGSRQLRWICQKSDQDISDGWRKKAEVNQSRKDNIDNLDGLRAQFRSLQDMKYKLDGREIEDWYQVAQDYTRQRRTESTDIRLSHPRIAEQFISAMDNWYKIVNAYTRRSLSVPTDRILAISAVAERYGRAFGDQYCAGIWRGTLPLTLLWKAMGNNMQLRPQKWQGPSWSWTSINRPVVCPGRNWFRQDGPKILDITLELTNPTHPYGALREGSGRLTLKGKKIPAVLMFPGKNIGTFNTNPRTSFSTDKPDEYNTFVSYDALPPEEEDSRNIVLLEFATSCQINGWSCRGLILRDLGEQTFVRLGVFDFATLYGRKEGEESEAWKQRVDQEYNPFRHCLPEVIYII